MDGFLVSEPYRTDHGDTKKKKKKKTRSLRLRLGFPQRYAMVAMVFACTSICYMERVGFSLAYTAAAAVAHTDEGTKGFILSAFFYGYVVSQIPGGWAAQRLGARPVLLLSFLSWSVICALTPTPSESSTPTSLSIFLLAAARFFIGVAQGVVFPCIHTLLAQWVPPHQRSRAVSLTMSGMYLGAALGMLVVPSLMHRTGPHSVFLALAASGLLWSLVWFCFASDPARSELAKASAAGQLLPVSTNIPKSSWASLEKKKTNLDTIPWSQIMLSMPVWAIVVNNFTFHYALYVLMNWLPTYFTQGLGVSLENLGVSKTVPYFNMFVFSNIGGIIADYLIVHKILSVTSTRKVLNTGGFLVAALALFMMTEVRSSTGAIVLSSTCLGLCALSRSGFAVNHMDIAPRYAGIVMGVSNTAGTLAGIVGVGLTGWILEAAKANNLQMSDPQSWTLVFATPASLCIISVLIFLVFATGKRIFD